MTTVYFLEAAEPLTKTFYLKKDNTLGKDAYPMLVRVSSHKETIDTIEQFHRKIIEHAKEGHCLLKGTLSRPLTEESRRGTTTTDAKTQWICLDFDRCECIDIDDELARLGLDDVSYVMQYSASQGTPGTEGTQSAHVFMLLDTPVPAPDLKAWLMGLNFKNYVGRGLELSNTKSLLKWPLDITTCQNDKLIYIAPPRFLDPLVDPLPKRIVLVKKKQPQLKVASLGVAHINALRTEERQILNAMRKAEGLPPRTAKTSWVGSCEVMNRPDVCTVTGIKDAGEFIRLNLNGGDSWAYWHAKDNFELMHDFKSDTWYKTKEIVPGYYQELCEQRVQLNETPTSEGDIVLAFCDLTTAEYYKGLYNPGDDKVQLYKARNETQLDHWMRSHGRTLGDFIPIWDLQYDPLNNWVFDEENHAINTFVSSPYYAVKPNAKAKFPIIQNIIENMLGLGQDDESQAIYQHFINWLAVVFQRKGTASGHPTTAWVTQGIQGTGKGSFFTDIITPLFGFENVFAPNVQTLEDGFNSWLQNKLFVMVEECDVNDFGEKGRVSAKLKTYISESKVPMRHMRQAATFVPTYAAFIFASNKFQPVHIEPSDRRYNVGNFQRVKLFYPGEEAIASELEAFASFLLAHRADAQQANTVLQTKARERIQRLGVTSIVETCHAILGGDFEQLWQAMPDEELMAQTGIDTPHTRNAVAYCMLMRKLANEALHQTENLLTRDELQIILQHNVGNMPQTPNKFTSLLRHNGIETVRIRKNNVRGYGLEVKWVISPELEEDLRKAIRPVPLRKVK